MTNLYNLLHKLDDKFHMSDAVVRSKKSTGLKSEKPADKIESYLTRVNALLTDGTPFQNERNKKLLTRKLEDAVAIKEIPESHFEREAERLLEQGHGHITFTDGQKKEKAEIIVADQQHSLNKWIDYLVGNNGYSPATKYWIFSGMLNLGRYDKAKHSFNKRTEKTVAPFIEIQHDALVLAVDNFEKGQLASFGKSYASAKSKSKVVSIDGVWKKYEQGSDPMELIKSIENHATGWCTAGEKIAKSSLERGDFHIFYSFDAEGNVTVPRAAIKIEDDSIAEVSGVNNGQDLESVMLDVVDKKLDEFPDKQQFKKKVHDMLLLTRVYGDPTQALTKEEVKFLWELNYKIEGFAFLVKDPRIKEIRALRDNSADFNTVLEGFDGSLKKGFYKLFSLKSRNGYALPEVVDGGIDASSLEAFDGDMPKIVRGPCDLSRLKYCNGYAFPEIVEGKFNASSLESLTCDMPRVIKGSCDLSRLKYCNGYALPEIIEGDFDAPSLEFLDGNTPKVVKGSCDLCALKSLNGYALPEVRGTLGLDKLEVLDGRPNRVGEDLYALTLRYRLMGYALPEVGRDTHLSSSEIPVIQLIQLKDRGKKVASHATN